MDFPVARLVKNPPAMQETLVDSWVGIGFPERESYPLEYSWASLVVQTVKNPPARRKTLVRSWIGKIPWRRAWKPTSVFLPGESPRTEEPGGLQSLVEKSQIQLNN